VDCDVVDVCINGRKRRNVITPASNGGTCPELIQDCPTCTFVQDGSCTQQPDGTFKTRYVSDDCDLVEMRPCVLPAVNCVVDDVCINGTKRRNVITPASNGGTCPALVQNCILPTCIPCQNIFAPNTSNLTMTDKFVFSINVPISFSVASLSSAMLLNIMQPLFADALGINWTNVTPVIFQEASTSNTSDLILCIYGDSNYIRTAIEYQVDSTLGTAVNPSVFSIYGIDTSKITPSLAGKQFKTGWPIQDMYNYYYPSFPGPIYYITH